MLARPNHCTKDTSTVHTVQCYKHSSRTMRASRYIARAGHARTLYKGYKHNTHCAMVQAQYEYNHSTSTSTVRVQAQYEYKHSTSTSTSKISTSPVLATLNTVQVAHAQYIHASNTHVHYARRPGHHAIYCTTHAYTYSRRVVQRSGCTCRPPYTHNTYKMHCLHCLHCPSRTLYRTCRRENVAHKPQYKFWPYTPPGREYAAMPRPNTGTVHMCTALARTNKHARPFILYMATATHAQFIPPGRQHPAHAQAPSERRTRRTTHYHGPESDHNHPQTTPDGPNTSTTLARRRLCIGARTNRYTILKGDDPNSPKPTGRTLGLHRRRTPQQFQPVSAGIFEDSQFKGADVTPIELPNHVPTSHLTRRVGKYRDRTPRARKQPSGMVDGNRHEGLAPTTHMPPTRGRVQQTSTYLGRSVPQFYV